MMVFAQVGNVKNKILQIGFFEKNSENAFSPQNGVNQTTNSTIRKCFSNEWSCQYVFRQSENVFVQFHCPALVTEVTISP
jgi:hypothetical protein